MTLGEAADARAATRLTEADRVKLLAWLDAIAATYESDDAPSFGLEMAEVATCVGLPDATLR